MPTIRRTEALERPWPWLAMSAGLSVVLALAVWMVTSGALRDPFGNQLRGYTLTGLLLGVVALALGTLSFGYSLRKRGLQERMTGSGTMMAWLWLHVAFGVVSLVAALLHAGYGAITPVLSTGKLLLGAFVLLVVSGIVWRVFYMVVPPRATARVGNFSPQASLDRAQAQRTEIDKVLAGRSEALVRLTDWILASAPGAEEVARAGAGLDAAEQAALAEIHRLAESRARALGRATAQRRYTFLLQGWRMLHVPVALLMPLLVVAHVVGATRLLERVAPLGQAPFASQSGIAPSSDCKACHRAIYDQWAKSMHAHAMKSPVTVVQNNQVIADELGDELSPDPQLLCINCHGPLGVALTQQSQALLPLSRDGYSAALLNEGIGCTSCHQLLAESVRGRAGLSAFQADYRLPGDTYFGAIEDPVGNAYHQSASAEIFERSEQLCANCHNVVYDRNGDGRIKEGDDLILQRTTEEYDDYRDDGGVRTCLECHMPVVKGQTRAAESADLISEQDGEAPDRVVHDHSFVGVDYPLDEVARSDPQKRARAALLAGAATLAVEVKDGSLSVSITNSGTGHNLPTGLAFARQMWLEVEIAGDGGQVLFTSGKLAKVTDDLCDADAFVEEALREHLQGCSAPDPLLVNFQQKLVERINAEVKKESVLQRLRGGVISRTRPSDGQVQKPIPPLQTRTFAYALPEGAKNASVRLLFRSFAPYFLRALAAGQKSGEEPRLSPLVKNLQVVEMAKQTLSL